MSRELIFPGILIAAVVVFVIAIGAKAIQLQNEDRQWCTAHGYPHVVTIGRSIRYWCVDKDGKMVVPENWTE